MQKNTTHLNPEIKNFPPLSLQQNLATTADLATGNYQSEFPLNLQWAQVKILLLPVQSHLIDKT